MQIEAGSRIGPYEVTGSLGAGGMGIVYAAADTRLGRRVAIKVLPAEAVADPDRRRRFMQEARAASALSHPHIAHVYDVVDQGDTHAIVMELVEGTTLDKVIAAGPLPLRIALDYASQIADALDAAHGAGIVHRDIKPGNIMVGRDGRVKVLDFGLAKLAAPSAGGDATMTEVGTRIGTILGTAAYMSPEQAQGRAVDARSDIFSFGAVLYEMLAGRRPFSGDSALGVISSILQASPEPLRQVPRDVETIVQRALQKAPAARYPNVAAMRADLAAALARLTAPRETVWKRPSVLVPAGLALAAVIGIGTWQTVQARGVRWARTEAIPEVERAQLTTHTMQAVRLARDAEKYVPDDIARVRQGWMRFRVTSDPAGAEVEVRNYGDVSGPWEKFGSAPVDLVLPLAYYRFRLTKAGYAPIELSSGPTSTDLPITLPPLTGAHENMVRVPGGTYGFGLAPPVALEPYWIDRLEVTNAQYKKFVDAGGYRDPKYWREPFVDGGRTLSFAEAMARFRDATSRTGPATWEIGTFPEGQAEYPVGGISWFEASAYAAFAGKRLPTLRHWFKASAANEIFSDILMLSNFDGKGPSRAGERGGVSSWGGFDMAGNVKEWCSNVAIGGTRRYILGGAWNEPNYRFIDSDAHEPWERDATFGVRLMDNAPVLPEAEAPIGRVNPDPATVVPASDADFEFYKRFYTYDRTPLDDKVVTVDDTSPDWRKETITFAAAYGGERVTAYLYTPKHVPAPFQTLVLFPTGFALSTPSSAHLDISTFDYLVKSGRAVLYPVYQGTFERKGGVTAGPNGRRDMYVQMAKDFFRAVDYLETRQDVDRNKLAYFSVSFGAYFGPIPVSLDPRMKVAVFALGGLRYTYPAEIQPANFMPRVKVPTLLVNGRDDFSATPEAQERFLALLGTPADRKKHIVMDGGHVPYDRRRMIAEVLDWYDKYLGPVK